MRPNGTVHDLQTPTAFARSPDLDVVMIDVVWSGVPRETGSTSTLCVPHHPTEAMSLADPIVLLRRGNASGSEGSVAQAGKPMDLYHQPSLRAHGGAAALSPSWSARRPPD